MGCTKSSFQREVCSNSSFPQEIRKISHKQPNCTPKGTRKRRTNNAQSQYKGEITKIREEINEIYFKIYKNSNANKSWFFEKVNKINKSLARLIKKKRVQMDKIRNEKEVTTNATEIQRIIRDYYEQLIRHQQNG